MWSQVVTDLAALLKALSSVPDAAAYLGAPAAQALAAGCQQARSLERWVPVQLLGCEILMVAVSPCAGMVTCQALLAFWRHLGLGGLMPGNSAHVTFTDSVFRSKGVRDQDIRWRFQLHFNRLFIRT